MIVKLPSTYPLQKRHNVVPWPLAMKSQCELSAAEVFEWQSGRGTWWKCSVIVVGLRVYGHKPCQTQNRVHDSTYEIFHMRNKNSRKKSITAISMVVFNTFPILIKELNKPEDKERKVPFWVTWK